MRRIIIILFALAALSLPSSPVHAISDSLRGCSGGSCPCDEDSIMTAVGCISTNMETGGFITSLLTLSVGVGGGIALLLMLYGTFIITTSAGIPDKLKAGKEIITSAVIGLVFIILSIVLMELIGVSILGLPGF